MIKSFSDRETQDIFNENYSKQAEKQLPREYWEKTKKIMDILDNADKSADLKLYNWRDKTGDQSEYSTLDISKQYRIKFKWDGDHAHDVFAGDPDYHS